MTARLAAIVIALALPTLLRAADAPTIADRLVRITTTYQTQNPFQPWQYQPPATRIGYGLLVAPGEILTTEHVVRNHTHVELRRARTGDRITAEVRIADPRLNLALLTVSPPGALDQPAIDAADFLHVGDTVTVAQFDDADDLQLTGGTVTEMAVNALPDGPYSLLSCRLLMQINVDGEGAPVIHSNRIAGLVNSYQPSTRIATMVGAPFVARFLADAHTAPYAGPASAGFIWKPLVDPTKRAWLRIDDAQHGIQVISVLPGAPTELVLRPRDVILRWDDVALDDLGYYTDPDVGRVEFSHLVKGKGSPGDRVPITIWRDGAEQTVALTLGGDPDETALIPENTAGAPAPYLVTGGFVLRELDVYMLRAFGQDWRAIADPQWLHLYSSGRTDWQPGDRVVVITGILPDSINIGYQQLRTRIVTALNGTPVRRMQDVFAISDRDALIERITVQGIEVDLVLDRDELPAANARLARQYRITPMEYRGGQPNTARQKESP